MIRGLGCACPLVSPLLLPVLSVHAQNEEGRMASSWLRMRIRSSWTSHETGMLYAEDAQHWIAS